MLLRCAHEVDRKAARNPQKVNFVAPTESASISSHERAAALEGRTLANPSDLLFLFCCS